ncbi:MAG: cell division protein FtsZ [bacterium]|nr:cell division protein FtsZ [bacterium]
MIADRVEPIRIRVLGIGGAGSNAVDQMLKGGVEQIDYVAVNTDMQALRRSSAPRKIHIGERVTNGLGAGGDPEVGRRAAMDSVAELEEAVAGCDMLFVVAGFGGGTGTGASPVVARLARERGVLTVCIATTPFEFEGRKRRAQAAEGIERMEEFVDTVIAVSNDSLFDVADMNLSMMDAFAFANDVLSEGVQCIARLINRTGLINLDFADVRTIMSNGGRAALGFSAGRGEGSAVDAARRALDCPLFDRAALPRARGLLISIMGGDDLGLREVRDAAAAISELSSGSAHVIFGALADEEFRGQRLVTVLATSLDGDGAEAALAAAAGRRAEQTLIDFDAAGGEGFERTDPTIIDGVNYDVPTFMRRGVHVSPAAA